MLEHFKQNMTLTLEKALMSSLATELLEQGFKITAYDAEVNLLRNETDLAKIYDCFWSVEELFLNLDDGKGNKGWIHLVFFTDDANTIVDYSEKTESYLPRTLKLYEKIVNIAYNINHPEK